MKKRFCFLTMYLFFLMTFYVLGQGDGLLIKDRKPADRMQEIIQVFQCRNKNLFQKSPLKTNCYSKSSTDNLNLD